MMAQEIFAIVTISLFIIISLISGTLCFIIEYNKNKKFQDDNPRKNDIVTLFLETYIMGGILPGFMLSSIIGIIFALIVLK